MPMPERGESRSAYVNRAIKYFVDVEGLPQRIAIGKAEGFADEYMGKSRKKIKRVKRR